MPEPIDVDDVELDDEAAAARRPGLSTRLRRRIARALRRSANRLRRNRS